MRDKKFRTLERAGGFVVFAIASFLHFLYPLSGKSVLGALMGSVNESVWEHLKIFAIAYLVWAMVVLLWSRPPLREFVWAKAVSVVALTVSIALFFFLYTGLLGSHALWIDLTSSLVFSFLAHLLSYKITTSPTNRGQFFITGVMILLLVFITILCFTYYPPQAVLFRDPVTGTYGVPFTIDDKGAAVLDAINLL